MNYDPMKPDRVLLAVEEAGALQRREGELWKEWIADKHRTGQHGYEAFLPRLEARCARMPALAHPEHFKPLGSSAATTSYGASASARSG